MLKTTGRQVERHVTDSTLAQMSLFTGDLSQLRNQRVVVQVGGAKVQLTFNEEGEAVVKTEASRSPTEP